MSYDYSVVMTIPAALRDNVNLLGAALGWGSDNFTVPLSADGLLPATHYGMHTMARQDFIDTLTAAASGTLPVVESLTPAQVGEVVAALTSSAQVNSSPLAHFEAAIFPLMRIIG